MIVLADYHHHALAESLAMLFEDRMGAELVYPYGMDWYDREVWQFERAWHGDAVARQYLLGIWDGATRQADGTWTMPDRRHPGRIIRGVDLDTALGMRLDLVISSLPHNDAGLAHVATATGARFGVQLGNAGQDSRLDLATFILASTTLPGADVDTQQPGNWGQVISYRSVPTVVYHQEFSRDIFHVGDPALADRHTISTFVNCFPETPLYPGFRDLARRTAADHRWQVYGSYGSQPTDELSAGDLSLVPDVADAMRATGTAWHTKYWSDGYGHVIHNWFAIGRPVVGSMRYYATQLAGPLWQDGVTGYDVDRYSEHELLAILRRLRDDADHHATMSAAAAARFQQLVDFDSEADAIRRMLGA